MKKKRKLKVRNPVAKNSRNKSGAGAHKSKKDYDRKDFKVKQRELTELNWDGEE
jgi:hypothetical protein|tara:strand:+ start:332 stop:493 length:162 start_codon:yes stop_codon:yes gene_type:complete